ncbi:MAG: alpha/beta fold hydrolase [Bacteriovoracia bacterium]
MASKIVPFETEDFSITCCDGEGDLFIRHFSRGTPKLHFLLVHGAIEHSGRHMDLVHYWLRKYPQVAVTIFDNIGHGRSGGTRAYVESFNHYIEDFAKIGEFVESKNTKETQTFICAHSLGGLITLTRLLDPSYGYPFPVKGLIFSSPCIRPRTILETFSLPILNKLNKLTPKLHLPVIYNGKDMTRDPDRANDFDTDPLIPKFMSVRMVKEILEASNKIIGLSYYLRIPSLFLIAGNDKIVDPTSTLLFAHGIDKQLTQIIQYPDHHHELWNEIDRQDIFQTMKTWVDKLIKESP